MHAISRGHKRFEKIKKIATRKYGLCLYNVPVKSRFKHPPPRYLHFWKIFVQIPPSRDRKAVQMPHYRSIPGDRMPPPLGNFPVVYIMLRKLCM